MEELDDGLLIYSSNANLVAHSFLLDDLREFSSEGVGGSILGGGSHTHSLFHQDQSSSILDSARCSYIAQPNSDILPFSTLEDAETGLEWLSAFKESSSGSDGAGNSGESQEKNSHHESKEVSDTKPWPPSSSSFSMVIPCRARSKRSRSRKKTTQDTSSIVTHTSQVQSAEEEEEEEEEKLKKVKRRGVKRRERSGSGNSGQPRRCTHCQTQKTPQWRQGPLGPKSLCNACGVRFKTGRLFPEYRPAKSPSFVTFLHSNSHKKVLEMRTLGICGSGNESNDDELGMHALPASAQTVQFMSHHSYSLCY